MLKRINDALPGLVFGIVFYGIVVQLIGVWFVTDKISYSIGLWYGIAIAVGIAVNIATVIYDATKNEILNSTTTFGGGIYSRTVKVYSFI